MDLWPWSSRSKRLLALLDAVPEVEMDLKVMLVSSMASVAEER